MQINDILNNIDFNNNSNQSYFAIETFILNLLKVHLEKNKKPFYQGHRMGFDAFLPEGIDNIDGPTQVEIKFSLERMPISRILDKFSIQISKTERVEFKNILIICPTNVSERTREKFNQLISFNQYSYNLFLWTEDEINKIILKNKKEAINIANNLLSLRIESVVRDGSKDWKEERKDKIEILRSYFKKGQFSFFLGAGVSSSAGMPDWNTLINSLFATYLTNEFKVGDTISEDDLMEIVERLNKVDGQSALMSARYLRKGIEKNTKESKEFIQAITKNLYSLRNEKRKLDSDLIKSIVEMCMPRRTGAKIKSVVTYNFDDLIERQLKSQSIQYYSIFSDTDILDPDELPVFHVHGFLPENPNEYEFLAKSTLVFSEEGYHQIYSDSYHWSNLVQLSQLRDNHCLMVGLSMSDPNLRRLLEISSRNTDKPRHFAFMKRLDLNSFIYDNNKKVISNENNAEKFLNNHHNLNEEIMRELGVSIIWYSDYEEIPEILRNIKK
jgi:hypothetical protein